MYVMSWIGISTSLSLVSDMLILLQSLADSLADININHLPFGVHPSLLAMLDDGVARVFRFSWVWFFDLKINNYNCYLQLLAVGL
jgi:hypothetical protein